jgi:hypothetical protein
VVTSLTPGPGWQGLPVVACQAKQRTQLQSARPDYYSCGQRMPATVHQQTSNPLHCRVLRTGGICQVGKLEGGMREAGTTSIAFSPRMVNVAAFLGGTFPATAIFCNAVLNVSSPAMTSICLILRLPHALHTYQRRGLHLLQLYLHYSWTLANPGGVDVRRACLILNFHDPILIKGASRLSDSQTPCGAGRGVLSFLLQWHWMW